MQAHYGVGHRCGSDPVLLWCRLAAIAPIQPLAWEFSYALGVALKRPKKKKKEKRSLVIDELKICVVHWIHVELFFLFFVF